jgi:excisionase family DNA binding protein
MMDKLYTPEGAAEALMVSPKTVREWLRTGKLGGVRWGACGVSGRGTLKPSLPAARQRRWPRRRHWRSLISWVSCWLK